MKKLRHFQLSPRTQANIAKTVGIKFDTLRDIDPDTAITLVEQKSGKKIGFNPAQRVDGYPLRTMATVDAKLRAMTNNERGL